MTRWQRLSSLVESEIISSETSSLPWTVLDTAAGVPGLAPPAPWSAGDPGFGPAAGADS
jgi:hypothetical protein